jgi:hypothetical protein
MRPFDRMARTGTAVDLAVSFAICTATLVFVLNGALEAAVTSTVCLVVVIGSRPWRASQIERQKRARAILTYHERMRRPLGL